MVTEAIKEKLKSLQDIRYRNFQAGLIPTVDNDKVIGVRTPELRKLAKEMSKRDDADVFLNDLPHVYFDEDQLHAFMVSGIKDFDECVSEVENILPYINNWATCDQMTPKVFGRHKEELLPHVRKWIDSEETYTVRFGVKMLMSYFLGDDFDMEYADLVAGIKSEEYYVNMMRAWYFATALAYNYDEVVPLIENKELDRWTHNKAIQKSVESYRITAEQKEYLKTLKY